MRTILLVALLVCGCTSGSNPFVPTGPYAHDASKGMAKVAVISATIDLDKPRFNEKKQPQRVEAVTPVEVAEAPVGPYSDPEYVDSVEPDPAPVDPPAPERTSGKQLIHVFAPQWDEASGAFLAAYTALSPEELAALPYDLELTKVPAKLENATFPLFVWTDAAGLQYVAPGWQGFAALTAVVQNPQQYKAGAPIAPLPTPPAPLQTPAPVEGKKKQVKRSHGYEATPGNIAIQDLLPYVIGDSLTLVRRGETALSIAVGYGVKLIVPAEVQITARKTGDVIEVTVEAGAPELHLPIVRKLYPIRIEGIKIENNRLTVILDGWKDYSIDLNW